MKQAANTLKLGEKLSKLRLSQQQFEYNLLDIQHPDFNKLEQKCQPLQSFSNALTKDILNLKLHCELTGRVLLSANQISVLKRFFVITKPEYSIKRQWLNSELQLDMLQTCINPRILHKEKFLEDDWEQSASFPTLKFKKTRFYRIYVGYQNEQFESIEEELFGWRSRLFQQGVEQLNGIIPFDEFKNMLDSELLDDYKDPTIALEEFEGQKAYRLFGKEKLEYNKFKQQKENQQQPSQDQSASKLESITETIGERKQSQNIFQNKQKQPKAQLQQQTSNANLRKK